MTNAIVLSLEDFCEYIALFDIKKVESFLSVSYIIVDFSHALHFYKLIGAIKNIG